MSYHTFASVNPEVAEEMKRQDVVFGHTMGLRSDLEPTAEQNSADLLQGFKFIKEQDRLRRSAVSEF